MPIALPDQKALVLKLKDSAAVKAVLPTKTLHVDGHEFTAVPHTADVWRVLRNMGVNVKGYSPFEHRYHLPLIRGQFKPGPHQIATAAFMCCEPRGYVLSTPRTGKTASALMAIDFSLQEKEVDFALVVAPRSCLRDVWENEAFGMFPHRSVAVLTGDKVQRAKLLRKNFDIYIINPDGVKILAKELLDKVTTKRAFVVIDESTDFANRGTARWKKMEPIIRAAKYAHLMTGTPGGPENVYGQATLCTPHTVPSSIVTWRDRTMVKINTFKWVPRANFEDHVREALRPSIRFDKKEIMPWLPKVQTFSREAAMSDEQNKAYRAMKQKYLAEYAGATITAPNAAVAMGKLVQIACGSVISDTGEHIDLDVSSRLNELLTIIAESEYKVIVFAPFKGVLRRLKELIAPHYSCAIVDGDVTGNKRDAVFNAFRTQNDPHVLLAHPKTTSFGLELAVADTIVFWGPPLNGPFVYQQAIERIQSSQQRSATPALVHLHSSLAEQQLFASIAKGVDLNERIVDLFSETIAEQ